MLICEHVQADRKVGGLVQCLMQTLATPIFAFCFDGCHCNRQTWKNIQSAGFSDVQLEKFTVDFQENMLNIISVILAGSCTK